MICVAPHHILSKTEDQRRKNGGKNRRPDPLIHTLVNNDQSESHVAHLGNRNEVGGAQGQPDTSSMDSLEHVQGQKEQAPADDEIAPSREVENVINIIITTILSHFFN